MYMSHIHYKDLLCIHYSCICYKDIETCKICMRRAVFTLFFLFLQILRYVIDGDGGPYCVGEWTSNPVGHIEVDPVHG